MKPIGLIFKDIRYNPYTDKVSGELMIVHLCLNCGKTSCNRIAGDDNSYVIVCLLDEPNKLSEEITTRLANQGIRLLTKDDKKEVLISLYGYNYKKYSQ